MADDLMVRFTSDWPSMSSPAGHVLYNAPRRAQELVNVLHTDLVATARWQRETAERIGELSDATAEGLSTVTSTLRDCHDRQLAALQDLESGLSAAVYDAADLVVATLERVGEAVCVHLSAVEWELKQHTSLLATLIDLSSHPRRTEAEELVKQGARHFRIEELPEAERKFRQALDLDSTDLQVLVNLGFLAIHHGEAQAALDWLGRALSLNPDAGGRTKAFVLWEIARMQHTLSQHELALASAKRAQSEWGSGGDTRAATLYEMATYYACAGRRDEALNNIRQSLATEPKLFSKAWKDPRLGAIETDVHTMLLRLAGELRLSVTECLRKVHEAVRENEQEVAPDVKDMGRQLRSLAEQCGERLESAGYSDCVKLAACARELDEASVRFPDFATAARDLLKKRAARDEAQSAYESFAKSADYLHTPTVTPFRLPLIMGMVGCWLVTALLVLPHMEWLGFDRQQDLVPMAFGITFWPGLIVGAVLTRILNGLLSEAANARDRINRERERDHNDQLNRETNNRRERHDALQTVLKQLESVANGQGWQLARHLEEAREMLDRAATRPAN